MKFVVYDDQEEFLTMFERTIKTVLEELDISYEIQKFSSFNKTFEKLIADKIRKIYVMDIEVPESLSGIEVAKKIRKTDWDSIIIMVTTHTELGYEALKAQIMLLNFISKAHDWESTLTNTLKIAISQLDQKKLLILESSGMTYKIHTADILYILKDSTERKCIIKTTYDEITVNYGIAEIGNMLDKRFYQTHRSCYVNLDNVSHIDWRNGIIHFHTKDTIDYLSRDRKKGLREYVRNN